MASKPTSAAYSSSSMKSLYMWCARRGSNSDEGMSTHTEGCFLLKSWGSYVHAIRWNHMSFIHASLDSDRLQVNDRLPETRVPPAFGRRNVCLPQGGSNFIVFHR